MKAFHFGQSSATAFPPPLRGRDREGVQQVQCLASNDADKTVRVAFGVWAEDWVRARRFIATPLPVPPPQGGREPWGTHLRTSHNVPVAGRSGTPTLPLPCPPVEIYSSANSSAKSKNGE